MSLFNRFLFLFIIFLFSEHQLLLGQSSLDIYCNSSGGEAFAYDDSKDDFEYLRDRHATNPDHNYNSFEPFYWAGNASPWWIPIRSTGTNIQNLTLHELILYFPPGFEVTTDGYHTWSTGFSNVYTDTASNTITFIGPWYNNTASLQLALIAPVVSRSVSGAQTFDYQITYDYTDWQDNHYESISDTGQFIVPEIIPPIDLVVNDLNVTPLWDGTEFSFLFEVTVANEGFTSYARRAAVCPEERPGWVSLDVIVSQGSTNPSFGYRDSLTSVYRTDFADSLSIPTLSPNDQAVLSFGWSPDIVDCALSTGGVPISNYEFGNLNTWVFIDWINPGTAPFLEYLSDRANNFQKRSVAYVDQIPTRPYPWPLEQGDQYHWITSVPNEYRSPYNGLGEHIHKGVDIGVAAETDVYAVKPGRIVRLPEFQHALIMNNIYRPPGEDSSFFKYVHINPRPERQEGEFILFCNEESDRVVGTVQATSYPHLHFDDFTLFSNNYSTNPLNGGLDPAMTQNDDTEPPIFSPQAPIKYFRYNTTQELPSGILSGLIDMVVYTKDRTAPVPGSRNYLARLDFALWPLGMSSPTYQRAPAIDLSGLRVYHNNAVHSLYHFQNDHNDPDDEDDPNERPWDAGGYIAYYLSNENTDPTNVVDPQQPTGLDLNQVLANSGYVLGEYVLEVVIHDYAGHTSTLHDTIIIDQSPKMGASK